MAAVVLTTLKLKPTIYNGDFMTLNKLTNERLANLRGDAQRMVDMDSPVSDREWWQACLIAVAELEERRKAELKPSPLLVKLPQKNPVTDMSIPDFCDWDDGRNAGIDECADAIRLAGGTVEGIE